MKEVNHVLILAVSRKICLLQLVPINSKPILNPTKAIGVWHKSVHFIACKLRSMVGYVFYPIEQDGRVLGMLVSGGRVGSGGVVSKRLPQTAFPYLPYLGMFRPATLLMVDGTCSYNMIYYCAALFYKGNNL